MRETCAAQESKRIHIARGEIGQENGVGGGGGGSDECAAVTHLWKVAAGEFVQGREPACERYGLAPLAEWRVASEIVIIKKECVGGVTDDGLILERTPGFGQTGAGGSSDANPQSRVPSR